MHHVLVKGEARTGLDSRYGSPDDIEPIIQNTNLVRRFYYKVTQECLIKTKTVGSLVKQTLIKNTSSAPLLRKRVSPLI